MSDLIKKIEMLKCDNKTKVSLLLECLVELGGRLHQQNNVIGNTNAPIAGDEIRASRCAVETKEFIGKVKIKILELYETQKESF